MIVFLNGRLVPEQDAVVPVFDRSFTYGDGLFETLAVFAGKPFRWDAHWSRLSAGADHLRIALPFSSAELFEASAALLAANELSSAVLRLTLSRGTGPRGYSIRDAGPPVVVMTVTARPPAPVRPWRAITSSIRIQAGDPLSQFKTNNKLHQIMARIESDQHGADEALLLNQHGFVVEGSSSNLFWIENGVLFTPPLSSGALPGITRQTVLELGRAAGIPCGERDLAPDQLRACGGAFLTFSTQGIVELAAIDSTPLPHPPRIETLQAAYRSLVEPEHLSAL
jgi:aminodeoxychorismate lyase